MIVLLSTLYALRLSICYDDDDDDDDEDDDDDDGDGVDDDDVVFCRP